MIDFSAEIDGTVRESYFKLLLIKIHKIFAHTLHFNHAADETNTNFSLYKRNMTKK